MLFPYCIQKTARAVSIIQKTDFLSKSRAGMHVRASLAHDDIARKHGLTVRFLDAQSLRAAVTSVLCGTDAFFMCKKLQAKLQHV